MANPIISPSGVRSLVLTESVSIDASPDSIWRVLENLTGWPSWNAVCNSARWTEGAPWEAGSWFRMVLRMAGVPVPFTVRVVEADPPSAVSWESTVLTVTGSRSFTIEHAGDGKGSLVPDTKTFTSPVLPLRLFYPRPIIQTMSRRWLRSLKEQAESNSSPSVE